MQGNISSKVLICTHCYYYQNLLYHRHWDQRHWHWASAPRNHHCATAHVKSYRGWAVQVFRVKGGLGEDMGRAEGGKEQPQSGTGSCTHHCIPVFNIGLGSLTWGSPSPPAKMLEEPHCFPWGEGGEHPLLSRRPQQLPPFLREAVVPNLATQFLWEPGSTGLADITILKLKIAEYPHRSSIARVKSSLYPIMTKLQF